ncbi:hypothetical protein [Streptomyces sp. NPDC005953]|uniref:hypothetical protein n=1 Tax=Streptomyces sp. NPDC005953 TaxID=3156719 RepID=UPI0033F3E352
MGVSYMVRGQTRHECQAALERLCRLLNAVPTNPPSDIIGPGWVARARGDAPSTTGENPQD